MVEPSFYFEGGGILDFFKSATFPNQIQDPNQVRKKYNFWRIRIFFGMYLGYGFYYFTRKSFTFAIPFLLEQGHTLTQLGLLGSIFSITYGFSKFFSGILGDKSNPRYFMSLGLILTGIFNLCFGFSSTWMAFAIFWALNAWFQGWGWPGCAKLLTHWYSQSERGTWWSLWNTSHNLGGALIPLLVAFCASQFGWRFAMFIPGVLCILTGLLLMTLLRDVPQSMGLPPVEQFKKEPVLNEEKAASLPVKEILFKYVLCNQALWLIAFAYFFVYVIRIGFNDWGMLYLIRAKGYSEMQAASSILWFEIGGFVGSLFAGWSSDWFFGGKRNPVNLLFTLGALFALLTLHGNEFQSFLLDVAIIFFVGFFIFGPQMLMGMVAAELTHKKAAATSSGFAGCFAYLGAAVAGGPLGMVIQFGGWDLFFTFLVSCGITASALVFPILSRKSNYKTLLFVALKDDEESMLAKIQDHNSEL